MCSESAHIRICGRESNETDVAGGPTGNMLRTSLNARSRLAVVAVDSAADIRCGTATDIRFGMGGG